MRGETVGSGNETTCCARRHTKVTGTKQLASLGELSKPKRGREMQQQTKMAEPLKTEGRLDHRSRRLY